MWVVLDLTVPKLHCLKLMQILIVPRLSMDHGSLNSHMQIRVRDQIGIYSQNQYLFQKNKLSPMFKDRAKWNPTDCHCKHFNSLILSCHTRNISKNCQSHIFAACRSDLDTSWECFMYDNSELSYRNFYNGSQWMFMIFPMSEIGGFFFGNKY